MLRELVDRQKQARDAGDVAALQIRLKDAPDDVIAAAVDVLSSIAQARGVAVILNDRPDLAARLGCDGVHVGQRDMAPEDVRRLMPGALIGLSVESVAQLEAAEAAPVDYYGVSPVFATATKADAAPALGLAGLERLRALTSRPLVAIGGIDAGNAAAVMAAGADGLAVVSALCAAADPAAAARALRERMG